MKYKPAGKITEGVH